MYTDQTGKWEEREEICVPICAANLHVWSTRITHCATALAFYYTYLPFI